MRNFFTRILGEKKKAFVFTTRNLANHTINGDTIAGATAGPARWNANDFITIDSIVATQMGELTTTNSNTIGNQGLGAQAPSKQPKQGDARIAVEPKAVFDEIKRETPEISFDRLDEKIAAVTERLDVLKQHLDETRLGDEHKALFYLKNRRRYLDTRGKLPLDWAVTTREAVDDLCKRYQLKCVPLQQYYTLVPKEGIKEMDRYTKAYKAITGDKPIFELVIKDTPEAKVEQRKKDRDPILLANSPLGGQLMIIGVWDDEVEVVDEIIYGMK